MPKSKIKVSKLRRIMKKLKHADWKFITGCIAGLAVVGGVIGYLDGSYKPHYRPYAGTLSLQKGYVSGFRNGHSVGKHQTDKIAFQYMRHTNQATSRAVQPALNREYGKLTDNFRLGKTEVSMMPAHQKSYPKWLKSAYRAKVDNTFLGDWEPHKKAITLEPTGVKISYNGMVYVHSHAVGYLNFNPKVERLLDQAPGHVIQFKPGSGLANAYQLGYLRGNPVSIVIPSAHKRYYEHYVSKHAQIALRNMAAYKYVRSHSQRSSYNASAHEYTKQDVDIMQSGYNGGKFGKQFRHWILYDINHVRKQHHLKAYHVSPQLSGITDLRTIQAAHAYQTQLPTMMDQNQLLGENGGSDSWIHGNSLHNTAVDDASMMGQTLYNDSSNHHSTLECAGSNRMGKQKLQDLMKTIHMNSKTPRQLAYNAVVNGMIDHDQASHDTHRQALLDKHSRNIQVGVKVHRSQSGKRVCVYVIEIN